MTQEISTHIENAQQGDAAALDHVVRHCQDRVHRLALRMLADEDQALDATQEILIRIVTKLSTFRGEAKFDTWAYRIATNYLLTARKVRANDPALTFNQFASDLTQDLVDDQNAAPDDHTMINEFRIKCTMAMGLCLDRNHRAAYVLGDIFELEHKEAAEVLEIEPATFRKRLSRARDKIVAFTAQSCGLANPKAPCRCNKKLPHALATGCVAHKPNPIFADAPSYAEAKEYAQTTVDALLASKLQNATGSLKSPKDFAREILSLVEPQH
ncbi:ECF RNA polymerase sigma factor SigW [Maritalea myrionectae]|uniref:ECF RNA polymerase sigma factor SigW n=1 Tax=Maritalea myrionectae TaxID=454601 RepID=A0A2R4MBV2_9HYPH|nr:RNA polymerase sigma factor [Maritalea myrionectae]AVX03424.1 ECF RNA polymerase sigma factor SigW [Maritalea myrionectae]